MWNSLFNWKFTRRNPIDQRPVPRPRPISTAATTTPRITYPQSQRIIKPSTSFPTISISSETSLHQVTGGYSWGFRFDLTRRFGSTRLKLSPEPHIRKISCGILLYIILVRSRERKFHQVHNPITPGRTKDYVGCRVMRKVWERLLLCCCCNWILLQNEPFLVEIPTRVEFLKGK